MRSYYWKLIRLAFTHSLDLTHGAIFILIAIAGATAAYVPSTQKYLEHLDIEKWQVGVLVLVVIFAIRLLSAPYWVHLQQATDVAALRATLHDICEERPFTYVTISCNAVGNNFHTTPTWDIRRINLIFENLSKRLLKFNVMHVAIEHGGHEGTVPVQLDAGTFIHGEQQMTYGFDVTGITTQQFPFVLTVAFDVHYDNVPPLGVRGTKRKVRYTVHSFKPVTADSLIIEQDEYRVGGDGG